MLIKKWTPLLVFVGLQRFSLVLIVHRHVIGSIAFVPSNQLAFHLTTRVPSKLFSTNDSDGLNVRDALNETDARLLSSLIEQRAQARSRGDYDVADSIKDTIYECITLPKYVKLEITDVPRKEGGGSTWKLVPSVAHETPMEGTTVLQLAHAALGLAISSSQEVSKDISNNLNILVQQAKERLQQAERVQVELRGRKAADAAFWFAMSGATDQDLFDLLADTSARELNRYGTKSSCRVKDVWHVLERLAAAGIQSHSGIEQAALAAFKSKNVSLPTNNTDNLLKFHSDRTLLMIWKFSSRQRKQRAFLQSALKHWKQQHSNGVGAEDACESSVGLTEQDDIQWSNLYKDPSRPLVIDVGCGMGVSLLGLAQVEDTSDKGSCSGLNDVDLKACNFAGVDLSGLAIGYARGLSCRWVLNDRLRFFVDSAEAFMEMVLDSYPGPVQLCLVQFPTPYRLQQSNANARGNSQLPHNETSGFMVTERLLQLLQQALFPTSGTLLLESNVEDVAVYMRQSACQVGFECVETLDDDSPLLESPPAARIPKRTRDWISMGGARAEGKGWSTRPLPSIGRTETEVACMANGTPVHRCVLQVSSKNNESKVEYS